MAYRKIITWFYTWRAWRRQKKQSYSFDKRRYDGRLGPGFLAFLERSRFYSTVLGRRHGLSIFRTVVVRLSFLLFLILVVWVIGESIRALSLY